MFLKSLKIEFHRHADFDIETYQTRELCIEHLLNNSDIIILDYHLNGIDLDAMNGIDTLDKIKAFNQNIPVIMLSSQDEINVAVNCMHHKATDYVVKSETAFMRLQKIISDVFEYKEMKKQLNWYMDKM